METTANWDGRPAETESWTRVGRTGVMWGTRIVRKDGTIIWRRRRYEPQPSTQVKPVPGERLLFYDYSTASNFVGSHFVGEWTAPADPDGYIRRHAWREVVNT